MSKAAVAGYVIDPLDPRAPPTEVWERMTPEEREQIVAMLPADLPNEIGPSKGDVCRKCRESVVETLDRYYRRSGRKAYVTSRLVVDYPNEPRFAPDVLAVLDVEPHERTSWVVGKEGKGLDFVLEVHVAGDFSKDHVKNVERYARLGIGEYFLYDRARGSLHGYRLPTSGRQAYERIVPQLGRYTSGVLGLSLSLIDGKLRFLAGDATLPQTAELLTGVGAMLEEVMSHKEELERQLAEERAAREAADIARQEERAAREASDAAREAEHLAREAAEAKLAEALALIEKLKKS